MDAAILATLWHVPGMSADSGTPTDWLRTLSHGVNVHSLCSPELAAGRFVERRRHGGHLDGNRSYDDVLASLRQLSTLPPLEIGVRIDVDMSHEPDINHIVDRITRLSEP